MLSEELSLYKTASELSLENAKQWVEDAKKLIKNSSFGHASALLRFSTEEIAKAYVCWITSEGIWPIENKVVKDVFRKHIVKNQVIIGVIYGLIWREKHQTQIEPSDKEIIEAYAQLKQVMASTERMRQKAIYVNLHLNRKEIETPLAIPYKEAKSLLKLAELLLMHVKRYIKTAPESSKEAFRQVFSELPDEVWETGEISIEWFRKKKGNS